MPDLATEEARSRMTLSEQERTLVSQARLIQKIEAKLVAAQFKAQHLEASLQAERKRLRAMVDGTDAPEPRD